MKTDALVRTERLPLLEREIAAGRFAGRVWVIARPGGWSVARCDRVEDATLAGKLGA